MSITKTRLIYHGIWEVRSGFPKITAEYSQAVEMSITQEFISIGCNILILKSQLDHIHCLFEYGGELGIPSIFKQVKGASSHRLNSDNIVPDNLYWEKGYDCYSISPNKINEVIAYINNQNQYHQKTTYTEELEMLRRNAGLLK